MDIDKELNKLRQIQEVEAPPFLLTRIHQRIKSLDNKPAPIKWKLAFVLSTVIILGLNLSMFFDKSDVSQVSENGVALVVSSMALSNSNELYHE